MAAKKTVKPVQYKSVRLGDYKGNPLLVFGDPESKFPFSFGKGKAGLLLAAVNEMGPAEFKSMLEKFVN